MDRARGHDRPDPPGRRVLTGDLLLRRRAIEEGKLPQHIFPQALPLDVLLHHTFPRALFQSLSFAPSYTARLWGALDVAVLVAAAIGFARAMRWTGATAFAVVAAIVFGGTLGLCTGYGKSLAELAVLVVVMRRSARVSCGRSRASRSRHRDPLAIALHRSGSCSSRPRSSRGRSARGVTESRAAR